MPRIRPNVIIDYVTRAMNVFQQCFVVFELLLESFWEFSLHNFAISEWYLLELVQCRWQRSFNLMRQFLVRHQKTSDVHSQFADQWIMVCDTVFNLLQCEYWRVDHACRARTALYNNSSLQLLKCLDHLSRFLKRFCELPKFEHCVVVLFPCTLFCTTTAWFFCKFCFRLDRSLPCDF